MPESTYFTQVRNCPTGTSCSVLHATVHAWHPMQVRWSIAKPYFTRYHAWGTPSACELVQWIEVCPL